MRKFHQLFKVLQKKLHALVATNWLTVLLILVSFGASILSTYYTYIYANESIDLLNLQVRNKVIELVQFNIQNRISGSIQNAKVAEKLLEDRLVDPFDVDQLPTLSKHFWHYFTSYPVSTFYIGTEEGNAFAYSGTPEMAVAVVSWIGLTNGTVALPVLDDKGSYDPSMESLFPPDNSDFTEFFGYQLMKAAMSPIWLSPYVYTGTQEVYITYATPVVWENDTLCCGVFVDISINQWKAIVSEEVVSKNGITFIATTDGRLIADSTANTMNLTVVDVGSSVVDVQLPFMIDSPEGAIAAAAKKIGNFSDLPTVLDTRYKFDGETYLLLATKTSVGDIEFIVGVAAPERDFLSQIFYGRRLAIICTSIAFGFFVIKYIPWGKILHYFRDRKRKVLPVAEISMHKGSDIREVDISTNPS